MKKKYLVIGSNNFWYAIEYTKAEALKLAKKIINDDTAQGVSTGYADPESGNQPEVPEKVLVYAVMGDPVEITADEE